MEPMPVYLITFFLVVVSIGIVMIVLLHQKKQLQYLSEKDQMKARFDREILESKLEIQEQTMKNISQEVHDNIGQVLSVVKLNINLMTCDEPKPVLQEKIKNAGELVGKVIRDLRDLSRSLDGNSITEKGLIKAIEYEFDMLKKTGVYTTSLFIDGEPYNLPEQKELILFRIFQETINNIIKHAQATAVDVQIQFLPQTFTLHIHDNGIGFDVSTIEAASGLGLRNIVNRSQLMGASSSIDSYNEQGTTVIIALPVAEPVLL